MGIYDDDADGCGISFYWNSGGVCGGTSDINDFVADELCCGCGGGARSA